MNRIMTLCVAVMLLAASVGDSFAQSTNRRARNVGIGVAVGVGTLLVLGAAANAARQQRECPGDSVLNSRGQCVKEYEPVRVRGESNREIIQKCNYYSRKCDEGQRWQCRKAADYCDRG